jgi:hypothetical protein
MSSPVQSGRIVIMTNCVCLRGSIAPWIRLSYFLTARTAVDMTGSDRLAWQGFGDANSNENRPSLTAEYVVAQRVSARQH